MLSSFTMWAQHSNAHWSSPQVSSLSSWHSISSWTQGEWRTTTIFFMYVSVRPHVSLLFTQLDISTFSYLGLRRAWITAGRGRRMRTLVTTTRSESHSIKFQLKKDSEGRKNVEATKKVYFLCVYSALLCGWHVHMSHHTQALFLGSEFFIISTMSKFFPLLCVW